MTEKLCIAGSMFVFLGGDNILSGQMYKQSKLQGHASYTSLETQQGYTNGHLAVKKYLNIGQGVKITPTGEQMNRSLYFFSYQSFLLLPINKDFCNCHKQNAKRQAPSSSVSLM